MAAEAGRGFRGISPGRDGHAGAIGARAVPGANTAYARLYLDAGLNHSSGYFETPDTSLEHAQAAKIRRILRHCRLRPGTRLLDVGCGWGSTALAASEQFGADVVGITIDREEHAYAQSMHSPVDFRMQGWEDFAEPVDRIVSVNAFENFANKRGFLRHCRSLLPADGIVVMLTVTADRPMFRVLPKSEVVELGRSAGFTVEISESLAHHYVRTLEHFVANLEARRPEAVAIRGEDSLDRHIAYYNKCAGFLRSGLNDMFEFIFTAE